MHLMNNASVLLLLSARLGVMKLFFDEDERGLNRNLIEMNAVTYTSRKCTEALRRGGLLFYLHQLIKHQTDYFYLLRRSRSEDLTPVGLGFWFRLRSFLCFFSAFILVSHALKDDTIRNVRKELIKNLMLQYRFVTQPAFSVPFGYLRASSGRD
jgi:hypothetical protein